MALPLFSTDPGKPGIIAVGGDAVGVLAIGMSATGIIAFGVQSRGLIAIACGASVGVVAISFGASVGLLATSVGFAGGLWGGAYGIELPVSPGPFPRRVKDTGEGTLEGLQPDESRWLRVRVERDGHAWRLTHKGVALQATLAEEAARAATSGRARVLVKAYAQSPQGQREGDEPLHLEVMRLDPLTTLTSARLMWALALLGRIALLLAIGWFLVR
jgi:hypothetical protein